MNQLDLVGNRYGKLTVVSKAPPNGICTRFVCICDCGKEKTIEGGELNRGNYKSCGCNRTPEKTKMYRDHPLYDVWKGMKARCNNKNHSSYKRYGGRGVKVCEEWSKDFISFYEWALANGFRYGLHIDKDLKGNGMLYSPDTCQWVTPKENSRNTTRVKLTMEKATEIRLSSLSTKHFSEKYGVDTSVILKIRNNKLWVQ